MQAGQSHHDSNSTTANSARKWLASKFGATTRLRPLLSRTSIVVLNAARVVGCFALAICAARNCDVADWRSRFFPVKNWCLIIPRTRQNAATLCPLWPCSEIKFRRFATACSVRCSMCEACSNRELGTRSGSNIAHDLLVDSSQPPQFFAYNSQHIECNLGMRRTELSKVLFPDSNITSSVVPTTLYWPWCPTRLFVV
jgi:hypothetical protein